MKHAPFGRALALALTMALGSFGCATVHPPRNLDLDHEPVARATEVRPPVPSEVGVASFYGPGFHGHETASGEPFDQEALTAAHRTLAFGTRVRVTNLGNGASVIVTVNDRGPYVRGRLIDLSRGAARLLGFEDEGTTRVRVRRVS